MSQTEEQQQQQKQQNHTTARSKKNKYTTRKVVVDNERSAGGDSLHCHANTAFRDKKPLHTSMEQLQVHMSPTRSKTDANRKNAGANWNCSRRNSFDKPKRPPPPRVEHSNEENNRPMSKSARVRQKRKAAQRNKYVAIDCEMVGVGHNGQDDMLARVSIVNKRGDVLLDKFVKPRDIVTDYRTSISGIRPHDIEHAEDFNDVQDEVVELLQGKILIGHGIRHDLEVLHIKHPYRNLRDTSRYKPLCRLVSNGRTPSLKRLSKEILGLDIQTGEHNSVEDARAAMNIYNRLSGDWEKYIQWHQIQNHNRQCK